MQLLVEGGSLSFKLKSSQYFMKTKRKAGHATDHLMLILAHPVGMDFMAPFASYLEACSMLRIMSRRPSLCLSQEHVGHDNEGIAHVSPGSDSESLCPRYRGDTVNPTCELRWFRLTSVSTVGIGSVVSARLILLV